ncbi:putative poly(ADP-ribose) polymerase, regulatory domain, WGR domain, WGR domain superfamily [Septoria linicola]|nr:putative poly(ADP-ribose) polymerase, regulatory domain, WGR domain, WGR domain superfamily [Septoria linicola]
MVSLRTRKRAASPEVEPDPPKKTRQSRAKTPVIEWSSDVEEVKPKKAPAKSKAKGKAAKLDLSDDEKELAVSSTKASGISKTESKKSIPDSAITGNAQYAKAEKLVIPVDEECQFNGRVYVDDSTGIIYDASLNQTNAGANANKFYKIQLLTNADGTLYRTWTRWGRVGERGQSALLGDGDLNGALKHFDKKFKDKSGLSWDDRSSKPKSGKYVFIERNYEPESSDVEEEEEQPDPKVQGSRSRSASPAKCSLEPPVKSLMELIFNQQYIEETMADMNYDAEKLPLGKLSKGTITRGYQALKDLSALFDDPTLAESEHGMEYRHAVENLSNQYYSTIPHAFGRNRPPVITEHERLKKEVELLQSLTDLKDADVILKAEKKGGSVHALDLRYNGLGMQEMSPVDRKTPEFTNISDYLVNTRGHTHGHTYEVLDIFRIQRDGETDRFEEYAQPKSDRRLLWHGSRATNFGGILSQGLRIAPPEAPVSGYMFGKGVYLADMASKSANYCCSYNSGGHALLLLCEAELGQPLHELTNASYTAGDEAIAKGSLSTWGKGTNGPLAWKDAKCIHPSLAGVNMPDTATPVGKTGYSGAYLQYNEYICYDIAQIRLRYLLRVKM